MSIANEINRLNNAKAAIKQSIKNKGVAVSDEAKLDEYPALIDKIEIGSSGGGESGGETTTYQNPDFYEIRTKGGTNYRGLFYEAEAGQIPDFSTWDTSKVTDMSYMFYSGDFTYIYSLDLSTWDTSKVTNMSYMFYSGDFTTLDLSSFDTSNVTNMNYMFYSCNDLTSITGELDASNLTNGFYPLSSSNPFRNCSSLETLYLKNIYTNCTMTNASKWSINLGDTKVKDECLIYIINELPDLKNDKGLTTTSSIVFTLPKTNTLTAEQVQVAINKGWSVANTTY